MQKNKQKNKVFPKGMFISVVLVLLIVTGISSAEKNKQQSNLLGTIKNSVQKQFKKGISSKENETFIPTEVISADQAVAFPTDI